MSSAILVMGRSFCPVHAGHVGALWAARRHVEQVLGHVVEGAYLACAPDGHVKAKYGGKLLIPGDARRELCALVSDPTSCTFGSGAEGGVWIAHRHDKEIEHIFVVQGGDRARARKAKDRRVQFLNITRGGSAATGIQAPADIADFSATQVRQAIANALSLDRALQDLVALGMLPSAVADHLAAKPELVDELRADGSRAPQRRGSPRLRVEEPRGVEAEGAPLEDTGTARGTVRTSGRSREVRAMYSPSTVRVYQAYNQAIAEAAVKEQRFVPPWLPQRMTWIKPSALWMGYRCAWARKDKNQTRVLAVDLHRESFDWLLREAVLAKCQGDSRADVVVQWDPERGLGGTSPKAGWTKALSHRSLQMGIRGAASDRYAEEFIAAITDVTPLFASIGDRLEAGDMEGAAVLLPTEVLYPLPPDLQILPR